MTIALSAYHFSLTCHTDDEAVFWCLRALWLFAEGESDFHEVATGDVRTWRASGEIVLRFSSPQRRGIFLGEATRLFAGKWVRLGTRDDDPPVEEFAATL